MSEGLAVNVFCIAVVAANGIFVMYRWAPRLFSPYLQLACVGALAFSLGNLATHLTGASPSLYWWSLVLLYAGLFSTVCFWWVVAALMAQNQGHELTLPRWVWRDVPVATLVFIWALVLSNPLHGLFITPVPGERSIYGPLWYGSALYCWLLIGTTVVFCSVRAWKASFADDRSQMLVGALAMAAPTLLNLTYTAAENPPEYDPTIVGFALSTSLFVFAVYRGQIYGATGVRLEDAIESDSRPGILLDRHERLVHANRAAQVMFGLPEQRVPVRSTMVQHLLDRAGHTVKASDLTRSDAVFRLRDDPEYWLSIEQRPIRPGSVDIGAAWFVRDESARVRADEALQAARKFESLGLIAGGVAHDFNNLLVSVVGNAELAQISLRTDPQATEELLARIATAGQRGAELARQLLTYAGKTNVEPAPVDLNESVREITSMLRPSMRSEVSIQMTLADEPATAMADSGQVTQVLLNLIVNAEEALPDGGVITVRTGHANLSGETLRSKRFADEAVAGPYVFATVADDGPGMDEATLQRVFDPFFSTKSVGRGLGLAATLGTIRSHHGALDVRSAPGQGTDITIFLPQAEQPVESEPESSSQASRFTGRTALLIEDDAAVSQVHRMMLEVLGFSVTAAPDGQTALGLHTEWDLVVADQTMPGMSGTAVANALRVQCPDLPIILVSGYAEPMIGDRPTGARFLTKPFSQADLADTIEQVLNG